MANNWVSQKNYRTLPKRYFWQIKKKIYQDNFADKEELDESEANKKWSSSKVTPEENGPLPK